MDGARTGLSEIVPLGDEQRERVRARLRAGHGACPACGSEDLGIGDALFLGFAFLSEPADAYMVGLTCPNPSCPVTYTGIRLRASEFLDQ
ncbi:hypothetical protein [Microbispora amethystogenes]|uniref:Uncharacterized protein n=1 Tax=Microbispora amethystogenes TaxID=1427754 RepID=A0ABQ4FGI1_9ACTN|nr:hypothetical protein [Microbispora amethystogenes]GIH33927.1 hypothetical protein Mam01_40910 [Microbispora amethystogenes]